MKKATTIQFNWIFVLIAGAFILLFFGSIVVKQKRLSELSTSQDLIWKVGKKLGVSVTELGKSEEIDFQGRELKITCHDLSSGSVIQSLADPVFSPENVKGARLITLTEGFYMPFHVTNFLYITSSSVRYIIVYDRDSEDSESLARAIKEGMGDKLYPELVLKNEIRDIEDLGHYKTKIIFVKTDPQEVNKLRGDVKAVQILDNNELKFFKGRNMEEEGESLYISRDLKENRETILGAIFAENKEAYECSLTKALKKLNLLSKLYIERTQELDAQSEDVCDYDQAIATLNYLRDISSELLTNLDSERIDQLKDEADKLEIENIELIMLSCPEIY